MDTNSLSAFSTDTLKEIINIGAGNAATALSQMTGTQVDISTPQVTVLKVEDVPEFTGKPDSVVSVVLVEVHGDAPGIIMLMFPQESALKISHLIMRQSRTMLNDMDRTALREVGNVLAGSCLTSLGNFLKMSFVQSVPNAATDMMGSLLTSVLCERGNAQEDVLVSEILFQIKELKIDGRMFFMFDPSSTRKILEATKKYLPS